MVRQLHVPEAGELIHEEGVLFDDGVENILGDKSQRHSQNGQVRSADDAGSLGAVSPVHERISHEPPAQNTGWFPPWGTSLAFYFWEPSNNVWIETGECLMLP